MRFRALRAAIVSIVQSRSMQQPKIDRFFDRARKKSLGKELGALWGTIKDGFSYDSHANLARPPGMPGTDWLK